jgi:cell division protein FtsB
MTDIEAKALALVNGVRRERGGNSYTEYTRLRRGNDDVNEALYRAIEQTEAQAAEIERLIHDLERQMTIANEHVDEAEALKQKVSDVIKDACKFAKKDPHHLTEYLAIRFYSLIAPETKPKPDPLFDVLWDLGMAKDRAGIEFMANGINAALEARGLEIREKGE